MGDFSSLQCYSTCYSTFGILIISPYLFTLLEFVNKKDFSKAWIIPVISALVRLRHGSSLTLLPSKSKNKNRFKKHKIVFFYF